MSERRKATVSEISIMSDIKRVVQIYSEKAMAPHSSTLAWKIPWMEEPGRLQSMGSLRSDTTERLHFHFSLFTFMHGRRKWQPTPVFLPGESQGWGSLVGCRLWGRTESTAAAAALIYKDIHSMYHFCIYMCVCVCVCVCACVCVCIYIYESFFHETYTTYKSAIHH